MPATATVTAWRGGAIDGAVPVAGMARSYGRPVRPERRPNGRDQLNQCANLRRRRARFSSVGAGHARDRDGYNLARRRD